MLTIWHVVLWYIFEALQYWYILWMCVFNEPCRILTPRKHVHGNVNSPVFCRNILLSHWQAAMRKLNDMSRLMTKPTKWHVRPAKTQISLGIRPVWSESSLCAEWVAKDPSFPHVDSEDAGQTGRMPRLIWVFAGRTVILLGAESFCHEAAHIDHLLHLVNWNIET